MTTTQITETLKTRATLPAPRSHAARARRLRTVGRLGALDGADDVAERVAEEGEEAVAAWPVAGWDEAAINAGVAQIRLGVLAKDEGLRTAYYRGYERGANRAHWALRE